MAEAKRWSYGAGVKRKNRVRVFEARSGLLFVEYWKRDDDNGKLKRKRHSLRHRDRNRAMRQAKAIAARIAVEPVAETGEITLGSLFDIYEAEVTPRKGTATQHHDRRAARVFLELWGRDRRAVTLNLRDWEQFIDLRRLGKLSTRESSRPVGDRQIEYDLKWLLAVYHWATRAGVDGKPLLERNPLVGYPLPKERNPVRPVMTDEQYRSLLSVAGGINWRLELALILANETGHRIGAIRHLRWSDIDLAFCRVKWRARHDKIGFEHITPISESSSNALARARKKVAAIGDTWVLPAARHLDRPCPKGTLDKWFAQAVDVAGVTLPDRARWHSLRRKFATELKDMSLKDLSYLGGWKDTKTLLTCYQQPDETVMLEGLANRRSLTAGVVSKLPNSMDTIADRMG